MISRLPKARDARGATLDLEAIGDLLERILRKWQPLAIWLFGSRARGQASQESDWDLLVVVPDGTADVEDPLAGWRVSREAKVRADVMLCPAGEFEDARTTPNTLAYEATHAGVLVYER